MLVLLLAVGLVAVFFILMSIRLIFLKNGEFRGTCASQSPWLNKEGVTCGYCGKTLASNDQACGSPDEHQPLPEIKKKA